MSPLLPPCLPTPPHRATTHKCTPPLAGHAATLTGQCTAQAHIILKSLASPVDLLLGSGMADAVLELGSSELELDLGMAAEADMEIELDLRMSDTQPVAVCTQGRKLEADAPARACLRRAASAASAMHEFDMDMALDLSPPTTPAASVAAGASGTGARQPARRTSFERQVGQEYAKHAAFRKDSDLVDSWGRWTYSAELRELETTLPPMSARCLDLLHIIWQLFERRGIQASTVAQAWMLCQSLHRGSPPFPLGFFRGLRPTTPGLHMTPQDRCLVPCLLPRSSLWLNAERRFAHGAEFLQWQGIHVRSWCPRWQYEKEALLRRVAGDMYSIPVIGWYFLLAMAALMQQVPDPAAVATVAAAQACALATAPVTLEPQSLAQGLLRTLLTQWPEVFAQCPSPVELSVGSLCSGPDYVKDFGNILAAEVSCLPGAPQVRVRNIFACEIDREVWGLRQGPQPECFFRDVHTLPADTMERADICLVSSMCTSVSRCNVDRRGLHCADPNNPKEASGATMASALQYVRKQRPKVVIMENVLGILDGIGQKPSGLARVLAALRVAGYTCGFDRQDAARWMLPQTRARVYIWAYQEDIARGAQVFTERIRRATPQGSVDFSAALLPTPRPGSGSGSRGAQSFCPLACGAGGARSRGHF